MAATRSPVARLRHILFHIEGISKTLVGVSFERFMDTYHLQRTVERGIEIISEAVKSLPPSMLAQHREVEWQKLIGIGNILRHEYQHIDASIMWDLATRKLPELEPVVRKLLEESK
jgi:uncharacterized protein with HEPN domain